ncbi:ATP-binding protein [Sorangium sp. So ce291]|uniref:ATP-binding protein n=1 Tax=Sorangium sp. So ce291 TaxID=3133294 RepID=UPI003F5FD645
MVGNTDFEEEGLDRPGDVEGPDPGRQPDPGDCAREPIHIPGSIQPHGVLLSLKEPELTIVQASASTAALLDIHPGALLGKPASRLLDRASIRRIHAAVEGRLVRGRNPLPVSAAGVRFDGILHRSDGLLVLELEPRDVEEGYYDLLDRTFAIVDRLRSSSTTAELCQRAAEEIGRLTGFDRTMIYRFHEDGHGEVIAESRAPEMEPYLHLHYRASDIPEQARRLYVLNRTRQIVDVDDRPAAILPPDNPLTGRPLDLSSSALRSVSPAHLEYLRNMGARASMSISLLRGDALWGLVACHHRQPHRVSFRHRTACELLGQVLAWNVDAMEQRGSAEARLRAGAVCARLLEQIAAERDIAAGLSARSATILDLVDAGGAAIRQDGRWTRLGQTPGAADLDELARWLEEGDARAAYATSSLAKERPALERLKDVACGVLAVQFPGASCSLIAWFRPELERCVLWGGHPGAGPSGRHGGGRLHPRTSFAAWRQLVRLEAQPWQPWEIAAAEDLRGAIVGTVLSRAAELERLNRELREAVRMRDDFMSMASHELRTPLFTLALQIEGVSRAASARRDAFTPERVQARTDVARRQVKRLEQLVGVLLDFSRINAGRLTLDLEEVSLPKLLGEVVARFNDDLKAAGCRLSLRVEQDIVGRWDPMRLDQVITNLLSNAIKYGVGEPIEIEAARHGASARVAVIDHGIGIDASAQGRIFERFERAVSSGHYSGLGLGLWIVHQIVERLGGSVAVSSAPGQGSTFTVELPLAGPGPSEQASPEAAAAPGSRSDGGAR